MRLPLTMRCTDNFSCSLINYYLRLKSMPFIFAEDRIVFVFFRSFYRAFRYINDDNIEGSV
jgi:hypothetical protein